MEEEEEEETEEVSMQEQEEEVSEESFRVQVEVKGRWSRRGSATGVEVEGAGVITKRPTSPLIHRDRREEEEEAVAEEEVVVVGVTSTVRMFEIHRIQSGKVISKEKMKMGDTLPLPWRNGTV